MKRTMPYRSLGLAGLLSLAGPLQAGLFDDIGKALKDAGDTITGQSGDNANAADNAVTARSAPAQPQPETPSPTDRPEAVDTASLTRQAQQLLNARGYSAGSADGISGENTRHAICHFQAVNDMTLDPRATPALIQALQASPRSGRPPEYVTLWERQCQIAHLNNLNQLTASEYNSYEGMLTADDRLCRHLVAPFELQSNFDFVRQSVGGYVSGLSDALLAGDSVDPANAIELDEARESAKKANWLPLDLELAYGERLHEERLAQSGLILSRDNKRRRVRSLYEQADAVLEQVLAGIDQEQPYTFQLFLVDDESVNAEALPGGYLYVNSGVFDTNHADLIIGHEVAHVVQRHTTRELQARLVDVVETTDDLQSLLSAEGKPSEAVVEKLLILRGAIAGYSQNQELQADACSVRMAVSGHAVGEAAIDAYVDELSSGKSSLRRPMSTHPAYPDRRERMLDVVQDAGQGASISQN
ncbi:M48 family metalloprotease [Marinobacter sp. JSM 1782161]|uniref:M48 family metalloprotease n=1 Tax=Marinobacter sp. JSM 1782161 TaxID=2685906 RepID=UPI0014020D14|nr:M48 family metalloprotease [Marinobacter sp. JSM 1782161]